jgi:hypothetical protein
MAYGHVQNLLAPSQRIRRHISILPVNCTYFLAISTKPDLKQAISASLPTLNFTKIRPVAAKQAGITR